jgi:hypothetical protein
MTIVLSAFWAFLVALFIYLLHWAGKHFLDHLFLPRFIDWWARRTDRWAQRGRADALKQAEKLIANFHNDLRISGDARLLLLHGINIVIEVVGTSSVLIIGILVIWPELPFDAFDQYMGRLSERAPDIILVPYNAVLVKVTFGLSVAVLILLFVLSINELRVRRYMRLIECENQHREYTMNRLRALLIAAGFDTQQQEEWLKQKVSESAD